MIDQVKNYLAEQANISDDKELQLLERITKVLANDFIELVRSVLREEKSNLCYKGADEVQQRIRDRYLN